MKSIDSLRRNLWFWKQHKQKNLRWLKMVEELPPEIQNKEGIEYVQRRIDRIETAIFQLKHHLQDFA